jgi:hypothetical protein
MGGHGHHMTSGQRQQVVVTDAKFETISASNTPPMDVLGGPEVLPPQGLGPQSDLMTSASARPTTSSLVSSSTTTVINPGMSVVSNSTAVDSLESLRSQQQLLRRTPTPPAPGDSITPSSSLDAVNARSANGPLMSGLMESDHVTGSAPAPPSSGNTGVVYYSAMDDPKPTLAPEEHPAMPVSNYGGLGEAMRGERSDHLMQPRSFASLPSEPRTADALRHPRPLYRVT